MWLKRGVSVLRILPTRFGGASEPRLLAGALPAGDAVILGRQAPMGAIVPAAAIAGLAIGLDSAPMDASDRDGLVAFAGQACGVFCVATIVTGLTIGQTKEWRRIGVRIAGSWISAVSALVPTLSLVAHAQHEACAIAWVRGSAASW